MKILTITSLFPNNIQPNFGNFIFQRMAAFSRLKGNNVTSVSPVPFCPNWIKKEEWAALRSIKNNEKRGGIKVHHPRYLLIPKISMQFHGLFMWLGIKNLVIRLHREKQLSLIDGHYIYPDGLSAVLAGKMLNIPVVLSARGSDIHQFSTFHTIRPQIAYALRHADQIISVCNALKEIIVNLGVPSKKVHVIPNGLDSSKFNIVDRAKAKNILNISINKKMILSVGGLVPVKDHKRFIESLQSVIVSNGNIKAFIIGEGTERNRLQDQINRLQLADKVKLVGQKPNEELNLWYNAADVFCLTSSREGWPNVLMESLACGTPVVATNVFGTPEIITSDNLGILVEQTADSIANGLVAALNRDWDRTVIRQHVEGRSWAVVAREVEGVFKEAIRSWEAGRL